MLYIIVIRIHSNLKGKLEIPKQTLFEFVFFSLSKLSVAMPNVFKKYTVYLVLVPRYL